MAGAGTEPFAADGQGEQGRVGVLLSHGFTGSPYSMRPWAERLAAAGYTVRVPLLPGHGTRWQDLNTTTWQDWYAEIRRSYAELEGRCDAIVAGGLSMGGTQALKLAEDIGPDGKLTGLLLVNPALGTRRKDAKLAKYLAPIIPSRPGLANDIAKPGVDEHGYDRTPLRGLVSTMDMWSVVVADLAKITVPIVHYRSAVDHVVDAESGRLLHAGATSTTIVEVPLPNSYHVATLDHDAELIFDHSLKFIAEHARTAAP